MQRLKDKSTFFKCALAGSIGIGIIVLIVLVNIVYSVYSAQNPVQPKYNLDNEYTTATLEESITGNTLRCNIDGQTRFVKLIGVDNANTSATIGANNVASVVAKNSTVYLSKDKRVADDNEYLLRYVWLSKPSDNPNRSEIETKMLNALLVKGGYSKPTSDDFTLSVLFHQLEEGVN